jgi:hypothetical protein
VNVEAQGGDQPAIIGLDRCARSRKLSASLTTKTKKNGYYYNAKVIMYMLMMKEGGGEKK